MAGRGAGMLQEEALKRKERLRALRERHGQNRTEDAGEPARKQLIQEPAEVEGKHRDLKLRNYVPEDVELKERQVPKARPVPGQWRQRIPPPPSLVLLPAVWGTLPGWGEGG
eukprot:gi/632985139/ref/XP_007909510.1/ PREDICTED: coiled-coil domain-containing protein 12-like [Callorhinchus milii]